ncbi:MAG TPA: phosphatidylinositol mannoside acyltransferase [Acidimicrobiales bacterium]|jgi:KDO2-lipid IV(A) lauroyltransferase|nr:phosphatidylinositol mannoside acyltransferase [Acidimicrobiales bacterium]
MAESTAKSKATYWVYRALGGALSALPEPAANLAAAVVGEVLARRRFGPKELSARHLTRVLATASPVASPDPDLVRRWSRRAFRAYARYWVEGARLPATGIAEVNQRMMVERGYEHLEAAMAAGGGVVMALPHVGSWEWGGAFLASEGYPMTSVAEVIEPPELFKWFIDQRRAMGLTIVPLGADSASAVLTRLREGGLVGLLCDRDLQGHGVNVEFFGEETTFPAGPATVALRTGATLITAVVYSGPGRDHTAVISAPISTERTGSFRKDVGRITQEIARHFEGYIRRSPEQWHLFQPNWPSDPPLPGEN